MIGIAHDYCDPEVVAVRTSTVAIAHRPGRPAHK